MRLHGSYTSPFVRHCRIVLAQTGLECEFVETDYAASAQQSPTCRVPFLVDEARMLTDSASIVRYLHERAGQGFCNSIDEFDLFLLVDTVMDSTVNLFLLEKDGVTPETSAYLARQQRRVDQTLAALEQAVDERPPSPGGDACLRLGCYLSWAMFRERISLEGLPGLGAFQGEFEADPQIAATHPAQG